MRLIRIHVGRVRDYGLVLVRWVFPEKIVRVKNGKWHLEERNEPQKENKVLGYWRRMKIRTDKLKIQL